jgi:uncharacterized protein
LNPSWLKSRAIENNVEIKIYVQPGARHFALVGEHDGYLKIKISAPPVDGLANEQLRDWIASKLGVSTSSVTLIRGPFSRKKVFVITGVTVFEVSQKLHV